MNDDLTKILQRIRLEKPRNPSRLRDWIEVFLGLEIPHYPKGKTPCKGHDSPYAYVAGSVFDNTIGWSKKDKEQFSPHGDCVVHACRSGGKTWSGGIAARIKAMFNPGCGIRILGGSGEQSKKMYDVISEIDKRSFSDLIDGEPNTERTKYRNGAHIEILMASQTSVRGPHVPMLMLDEVDEIKKSIYDAAVGIAQSSGKIRSSIEQFSTAHKAAGLMQAVLDNAQRTGKRIYRYCIFEVLKPCPYRCTPRNPYKKCREMVKYDQLNQPHRWSDVCACKAKRSRGYYDICDLWQKFESLMSWEAFAAEYLCEMPKTEDAAFPMLSDVHLVQDWPCLPSPAGWLRSQFRLVLGADAGPVNTWVVWALVGRLDPKHDDFDTFHVIHQLVIDRATAASDRADMIVAENGRMGFPKAAGIFTGPSSVPQDSELAMELDNEHRLAMLFLPSPQSPAGRRCMRCASEGKMYGWETIGGLLVLRTVGEGPPRPAFVFGAAARATYDALAAQQKGADEAHGVAATRYLVRGWETYKNRITAPVDEGGGMVIATSG